MATVIGLTAARGEEIAAEHVESLSIDGGNLVVTRRNAETVSVALPVASGGIPGGVHAFNCTSRSYTGDAANGTQLNPLAWTYHSTESWGKDGTQFESPSLATPDVDGTLLSAVTGWVQVRVMWHLYFDLSAPTSFAVWAESNGLNPRYNQYFPIAPARPLLGVVEGLYRAHPHTSGEFTTPPVFASPGDPILNLRLWWNTNDQIPKGGFSGSVPTLQAHVTQLA